MKVSAKSNFEDPPPGTHLARCIGLIGIGTHKSSYAGEERYRDEIVVMWELPHEKRLDGKSFSVFQHYTRSLGKKATLRKILVDWRGRDFTADELDGFELKNILDKGCQVVLTQNEKGYINVTGVVGTPKGTQLPDREYDLVYCDVVEWDEGEFGRLSKYFQDKITSSYEYREQRDYGRILSDIERIKVDRDGPQALGDDIGEQFSGPPVTTVPPDDDIPF
ncbi:hypothetical protein BH10ACI2_BH10ACI2_00150 [soil metagenome]